MRVNISFATLGANAFENVCGDILGLPSCSGVLGGVKKIRILRVSNQSIKIYFPILRADNKTPQLGDQVCHSVENRCLLLFSQNRPWRVVAGEFVDVVAHKPFLNFPAVHSSPILWLNLASD